MSNKNKIFWDKLAPNYNRMFEKNKAYLKMYDLIKFPLRQTMTVLEIGAASGMIARNISDLVSKIYAIDYSEKMIDKAKILSPQNNIFYSVQDSSNLDFDDNYFDSVIIANVLHIMDNPENTLDEIKRVLKPNGILIAPTFMWKEKNLMGKIEQIFMRIKKFPINHQWNSQTYKEYLENNGFSLTKQENIKSSFNISYIEAIVQKNKFN